MEEDEVVVAFRDDAHVELLVLHAHHKSRVNTEHTRLDNATYVRDNVHEQQPPSPHTSLERERAQTDTDTEIPRRAAP